MLKATLAEIADFEPTLDKLRLEMSGPHADVTLTPLEEAGSTRVDISFMAEPYSDEGSEEPVLHVASVIVKSTTGITMNDIEIVSYTVPAAA